VAARAEQLRSVLVHHLRSWGAEVEAVGDAASAHARLALGAGPPLDVALVDCAFDERAPLELIQRLRAAPADARTALVALTRIESRLVDEDSERAGLAARISKPLRSDEIFETLAALLSGNPLPRASSSAPDELWTPAGRKSFDGVRVLVVEDNAVNLQVAVAMLQNLGCAVESAENGQQALEVLGSDDFDLVFMDCQMPVMDGLTATAAIRGEPERNGRRLPIVALTAHTLEEDRRGCLAAGMDDFVTKPFTERDLARVIERWVGVEPSSRAMRPPARDLAATLDEEVLTRLEAAVPGVGASFIAELAEVFLARSQQLAAAIREGVRGSDRAAIARAAHELKSSSAQLGAEHLASVAKELEACARTGGDCGALALRFDAALASAQEALAARGLGAHDEH
jgi:CheY-like chemotaxis protein